MYGPAALILAGAGLSLAAASGRPELRRGALHGALLTLVGAQAVALFPQASFTHEFLSFPLSVPVALGVALVPACARAHRLRRFLAPLSLAAVAAAIALGQRATWARLEAQCRDGAEAALGRKIAAIVPFDWAVATPGDDGNVWVCTEFYADRAIEQCVVTLEEIERLRRRPIRPGHRPPVRYVLFTRPLYEAYPELASALLARFPMWCDDQVLVFDLGPPPPPPD